MEWKELLARLTRERFDREPDQCSDRQLYEVLLLLTRTVAQERPAPDTGRKLYYFSAEFLVGKLLSNNLLALGLHRSVKEYLAQMGRDLGVIESLEPEPSLGNGGLGRLAACYLDSVAALGLPGDGAGVREEVQAASAPEGPDGGDAPLGGRAREGLADGGIRHASFQHRKP